MLVIYGGLGILLFRRLCFGSHSLHGMLGLVPHFWLADDDEDDTFPILETAACLLSKATL